ncbi:hypothetical protein [Bradyrhizobium sp. ERR14]|uniref:hypothetical protein n=1 Tax=Bradyrhizobium sp. ERR14 TaxID=2663837 RepID=UPI00161D4C35|nr:hypothetical protein [Bradyrhizobium sp. ERR14]MBB4397813.1 hypothetical protein [Bradyrhizobium sp. ERR14]
MIYAPDTNIDKQLLSHSHELVREAMALLRSSDHLVSALRLRDELEQERRTRCTPPAGATADLQIRRQSEQMREGEPGGHRQAQHNGGVR